jgi:hypothetical protein
VEPLGGDEAQYSFVGGGYKNHVEANMATVSGGEAHTVWDDWGAIGGGDHNQTGTVDNGDSDSGCQTVAGGSRNLAQSSYSAVGGGHMDSALGTYSTVPGGHLNTAGGAYSLAAGRRAKARHAGAFVWADSTDADFASTGENQFLVRASGGVGINTTAPSAALHVGGTPGVDGIKFPDGTLQTTAYTGSVPTENLYRATVTVATMSHTDLVNDGADIFLTGIHAYASTTSPMSVRMDGIVLMVIDGNGMAWYSEGGAPILWPAGSTLSFEHLVGSTTQTVLITGFRK